MPHYTKGKAVITITHSCRAMKMCVHADGSMTWEDHCKLPDGHDGDHVWSVIDTTARDKVLALPEGKNEA